MRSRGCSSPTLEQDHPIPVGLGRAQAEDAADRRHDDDVAPRQQRRGGGVAETVDLVVDRRVLLDVRVRGRDVGLGLVVVVVADEVLDRRARQQLAELVAELGRERLVVRDDQRRAFRLGDHARHGEGLARAGDAEERLEALAAPQALRQLADRPRLVARRLVGLGDLVEGRSHPPRVAPLPADPERGDHAPGAKSTRSMLGARANVYPQEPGLSCPQAMRGVAAPSIAAWPRDRDAGLRTGRRTPHGSAGRPLFRAIPATGSRDPPRRRRRGPSRRGWPAGAPRPRGRRRRGAAQGPGRG